MISLITAFRKFKGPFDIIQKSVLYSWKDLPVIVPVNEVDTLQVCSNYKNVKTIEKVVRGIDKGYLTHVPFFKDLMQKAMPLIDTPMVAFINSDIVLLENFKEVCLRAFEKYGFDLIITGTRYDVRLDGVIHNEISYKAFLDNRRSLYDQATSDIFITSKFIWRKILSEIPDFLMGRSRLMEWLHNYAEVRNAKRYNSTNSLITLHCIHGQNRLKGDTSDQYNQGLWNVPVKIPQIRNWPSL